MKQWKHCGVALAALALLVSLAQPYLQAQVPAAPAPPAGASGIVGLAQMLAAKCKACKAKICACPLGQLLVNMAKPINMMLGGLLCPPCCPPINPDDLKKSSVKPEGACAKIMQSEMEMPARRKAIQCLAHVDCHWWPEAEAALITGLRVDTNECVRMEAALALGNGCCCTKKTIEALAMVVSGSKKDGNPSENSERVKTAALGALQHCLAIYCEEESDLQKPENPVKPAAPPSARGADATPLAAELDLDRLRLAYYDNLEIKPSQQVLDNARKVLATTTATNKTAVAEASAVPTGSRNLYQLWVTARGPAAPPAAKASNAAPPLADNQRLQPDPRNPVMPGDIPQEPIQRAILSFQE